MSDIKLFRIENGLVAELEGKSVALEKSLQDLLEKHLDEFLGVRFLASEYGTGRKHGGRIDTLGIDENGCPVIIEYKRATNENVINQGLFYLDWLLDHKAEFKLLVIETLGADVADSIDWSSPRLVCIAGDFTKYDQHAVEQINRNIELMRYKKYGDNLLLLELINVVVATSMDSGGSATGSTRSDKGVAECLAEADDELRDLYEGLRAFLLGFGDDVQEKTLKFYIAFKRLKNFACVEVHRQTKALYVCIKVNPDSVELEDEFSRDVRQIGHYGTGDLQLKIRSHADLEKAKDLLTMSYEAS